MIHTTTMNRAQSLCYLKKIDLIFASVQRTKIVINYIIKIPIGMITYV